MNLALLIVLAALAAIALLSSWEQLRQLRAARHAHQRARRAAERAEERSAATRAALNTCTVERDGRESDYYAARGEAARARRQVAALSAELTTLRLRLAQATGTRTVLLWPEDVARATVVREIACSGRALAVQYPGAGPLPTWRVADGLLCTRWGVA
jgi:hypothetical protein